ALASDSADNAMASAKSESALRPDIVVFNFSPSPVASSASATRRSRRIFQATLVPCWQCLRRMPHRRISCIAAPRLAQADTSQTKLSKDISCSISPEQPPPSRCF
ncbi:MAG: hypothetical protein Q8Q79_08625, partial [Sphingopyxis sp.]|nr:hypothetical protein [Sphingopyxis sp.]